MLSRVTRVALAIGGLSILAVAVPGSPAAAPQFVWSADRTTISLAIFAVIFAIVALSFATVMRLSGLPSVAHSALWGVGAYTAGVLTVQLGWDFAETLPMAILVPSLVAALLGVPAFRTTGAAFLVITIVLAEFVVLVIANLDRLTNGSEGLAIVGASLDVASLDLLEPVDRYYLSLGFLYVSAVLLWLVVRSRLGRRLEMIRDDEALARTVGLDPSRYKLVIFAVTAGLAGAAGQLYLYQQQAITPELFGAFAFIPIILMAILGGLRSITGPIIGAFVVTYLPTWFGSAGLDDPNSQTLIYGALLLLVISVAPRGIVGLVARGAHMRRRPPAVLDVAPTVVSDASDPTAQYVAPARLRPEQPDGDCEVLLDVRDLSKRFGAVTALDTVNLQVSAGEILGIIGPNGSGKTTLFNCISGFVPCEGSISWRGRAVRSPSPQRLARSGLVRTFQQGGAFSSMTAREACSQVLEIARVGPRDLLLPQNVDDLLAFCDLLTVADHPFATLTYGQRRLLGVALALACQPVLLMLDEPAAGLNDSESERLRAGLRATREAGVTLVVIDHDMSFLLPLCDEVVVLDAGQLITTGRPEAVVQDPRVIAAYLGEDFAHPSELVEGEL